jgi:hypothetical protein
VRAALLTLVWAAVMPTPLLAAGGMVPSAVEGYGSRLEMALNSGDSDDLIHLTSPDLTSTVQRRYDRFATDFPETRWRVEAMDPLDDGRSRLRVAVSGSGTADGQNYRLEASQVLAVRIEAGVMVEEELLEEQSLLRSGTAELPITVQIPGAVLTGSRYDIDVIFDEPLGQAVAAGGLIELTPDQRMEQQSPLLQLLPLGGGGLFKQVQAPQQSGVQAWAVMLIHPDGVVTATKQVRVVDTEDELARF